jgi:hypothetical protein
MKFKALREKDTKKFIEISKIGGVTMVFTSELPHPMSINATMEGIKSYYAEASPKINMDNFELIEYELFEADTVGADIRNKLTPPLNLLSLLRILKKKDLDDKKRKAIQRLVDKEINKCEKCIKYIANLI